MTELFGPFRKVMAELSRVNGPSSSADTTIKDSEKRLQAALNHEMQDPEIRRKVKLLKSNGEFRRATADLRGAFQEFLRSEDLEKWFPTFAALSAVEAIAAKPRFRETWEPIWEWGTGQSWKSLKDFPKRLRKMASEIEKISASPCFSPEKWIVNDGEAKYLKKHFRLLPGIMRHYAAFLESVCRRLPAATKNLYPPLRRLRLGRTLGLSFLIRFLTGRFHDAEVCALLNAGANALESGFNIDPPSLAEARRRTGIKVPPLPRRTTR